VHRESEPTWPESVADDINRRISELPHLGVQTIRAVRRHYSQQLRTRPAADVIAIALALRDRHDWVAYELLFHHPTALAAIDANAIERLAGRLTDWGSVDAFGTLAAGPAWRLGAITDATVQAWAASPDRWWRRTALVATVALNVPARGGTGDPDRTLSICARLADDHDDMVVKALSWALRELVRWEPDAVRAFLTDHRHALAPRVTREVNNKLTTGLKNPRST
jgi:3-methyladenine DNA glycosylase AlkD